MTRLNPYLSYKNEARDAMEFYKSVFGGNLVMTTFQEGGMPHDPADDNKIMHAMLEADNGITLMGADTPEGLNQQNGSISLSGEDESELRGYWDKLSEGATIREPLVEAPWGDTFGMLADKFGIEWMVNISGQKS